MRWSPSEKKFAVGSGARVIAVCYFEEENDWWVSKHLKKPIRSTITTVAWHPNSVLLAAGSTDAHARVFSAFIKGVDERPESSVWGERLPFNTVCGEYLNNSAGWVHGCAFSPSGNALAFTAHDSSITVVYPSGPDQAPSAVVSLSTQLLPFLSLIWTGESEIVAAGYVSVSITRMELVLKDCRTVKRTVCVGTNKAGRLLDQWSRKVDPAWVRCVKSLP